MEASDLKKGFHGGAVYFFIHWITLNIPHSSPSKASVFSGAPFPGRTQVLRLAEDIQPSGTKMFGRHPEQLVATQDQL